jgi:hypothetical protein
MTHQMGGMSMTSERMDISGTAFEAQERWEAELRRHARERGALIAAIGMGAAMLKALGSDHAEVTLTESELADRRVRVKVTPLLPTEALHMSEQQFRVEVWYE